MEDPVLITSFAFALLLVLVACLGRRKVNKPSTKWRKAVAGSLWAVNAMLFGGVSDPVEKGKVVNIRKRDFDEDDEEDSSRDEL
jgi:hypothetical protein